MTVSDISIAITGVTRGMGRVALRELVRARPSATIFALGRSSADRPDPAGATADAGSVRWMEADLADLASIRRATAAVRERIRAERLPPVSVVVHNAGAQFARATRASADGVELTFAVNVLAPYAVTEGLRPVLADRPHLVFVGSGTHERDRGALLIARPEWRAPELLTRPAAPDDAAVGRSGQVAYSTSKLAVNLLSHEYSARNPAWRTNVFDPGLMPGTGLARANTPFRRWMFEHVLGRLPIRGSSTPERSGALLARLALGLDHAAQRDAYIEIDRVGRASAESRDPDRSRALWSELRRLQDLRGGRPRVTEA